MAHVRQWLPAFFKRHTDKFRPHDWPSGDDIEETREFFVMWVTAFATREVTEAEADEASRLLGPTPPNFRREHLPAVLGKIEAIRRERGTQPGTGTREAARDQSRNCEHCGGDGLATVWAERPDLAQRVPATIAAYCVCPHGRWIRRNHAQASPEMLRRIPDLGDVLDGRKPGWLAERPESAPAEPVVVPTRNRRAAMFPMPNGVPHA